MNWQDIKASECSTYFLYQGKQVFEKQFIEVLKFHAPGIAPVKDESGSYHINSAGEALYPERFLRTFGFYCYRAAVVNAQGCFHLTAEGISAYPHTYTWTGNFQENFCPVREGSTYFHIDLNGNRVYKDSYAYCGDFKDGIACVKTASSLFRHIRTNGDFLHGKSFTDLGIYHKNFATAKDEEGWHHIDKNGIEIYRERYQYIEPFYNGFALVTQFDDQKVILDEQGRKVLSTE